MRLFTGTDIATHWKQRSQALSDMYAAKSISPISTEHALRFVTRAYLLRTIGLALAFLVIASVLYANGANLSTWTFLLLNGFVWPQLARLAAEHSADPAHAEVNNLLVDSVSCGIWIALMRFNLLPSVALMTVMAMCEIAVGGHRMLLRGLVLQVAACAMIAAINGFAFSPETSVAQILAATPLLLFYPAAVSAMMYQLGDVVRRQNRLLCRINSVDPLSDLLTRTYWEAAVQRVLDASLETDNPASLLMVDIDHFKSINDRYGHAVGDEVIGGVGAVIRQCIRECDAGGRYGGDEFGIVLGSGEEEIALGVAERVRASVAAIRFASAPALRCTLSIGVAQFRRDTADARAWIHEADVALYRAKLAGRNQYAAA